MTEEAGDGFDVRSLSVTYREGHTLARHQHPWAQLIYARKGLLYVETGNRIWFVPPTRAVWVPPLTDHLIAFKGEVEMRTLYIAPARGRDIPPQVNTLEVSPLLSQLIQHIQTLKMLDSSIPQQDHLACVLVDLIRDAPSVDMALPLPDDERAARLATHIRDNPLDRRDLDTLAREFGASLRTMQRHFAEGTGMPLDTWRQKARLISSIATLSAGGSVSDAAQDSGYEGSSAFVAAFKKQFGITPGRFETGA